MKKTAIITGITGQDGSYLAELLLEKDYEIYGLKRRTSGNDLGNASHLANVVNIVEGDLLDLPSLTSLVRKTRPHEFYNLAAQSHVFSSFEQPVYTLEATGKGVVHCLEAIRESGYHTKFYQASTSELFGGMPGTAPQNESTRFCPRSPYGAAKLYGLEMSHIYRDSYRMFCCNGILFNHESPRRGPNFVTRKITLAAASIALGLQSNVYLGNLDARRDWGHSKDFVRGMHLMLQQPEPDDYVLATGVTHTVKDFCYEAFKAVGLNYAQYVIIDPVLYRPCEVHLLLGDASKAKNMLGWEPEVSFEELVQEMVDNDMRLLKEKQCMQLR